MYLKFNTDKFISEEEMNECIRLYVCHGKNMIPLVVLFFWQMEA